MFRQRIALIAATYLAAVAAEPVSAQQPAGCQSPAAHAFDFWIGDWDIQQRLLRQDGSHVALPAETSVTRALDGCALVEHWKGRVIFFWDGMQEPEVMWGLSVRVHDPRTDKWYIHWMDTRAPRFGDPYVGTFHDGRGEFFREWDSPRGHRIGRITFADITADSVNWALAVSSDSGQSWQTLWTMAMRRHPAPAHDR